MSKTLAKEVHQFNIRSLIVSLGGFDTNMPTKFNSGKNPIPEDYSGSDFDKLWQFLMNGGFKPDGDKGKACKAIYDVVMGEGIGLGHEAERFLPLGRDAGVRVKDMEKFYVHAQEVFGDICNNVYKDKS
jgi:hypothetical protein